VVLPTFLVILTAAVIMVYSECIAIEISIIDNTIMFISYQYNLEGDFEIIEVVANVTTIDPGGSAVLTCKVSYQRSANIAITWLKNGQRVNNSGIASTPEEDRVQEQRRVRTSRLLLGDVEASSAGLYFCLVSDGSSSVNKSVQVQVAPLPGGENAKYGTLDLSDHLKNS